jgi:hypothetical protein
LHRIKKKAESGSVLLTTHRIIWFRNLEGLEMPLFYVRDYQKGKKFFGSEFVTVTFENLDKLSPHVIEYHQKVLKSQ